MRHANGVYAGSLWKCEGTGREEVIDGWWCVAKGEWGVSGVGDQQIEGVLRIACCNE